MWQQEPPSAGKDGGGRAGGLGQHGYGGGGEAVGASGGSSIKYVCGIYLIKYLKKMVYFPFFVNDMTNPVLILILIPILLQHHTTIHQTSPIPKE